MSVEKDISKKMVAEEEKTQITKLISGVFIAYAITCIVMIGYAILITYGSFTGNNMDLIITITTLISVVIAGFDSARGAKNKGWMWGILSGLMYAFILISLGIWVNRGFIFDTRTITMIILSIAGGGLGGVIGINLKSK